MFVIFDVSKLSRWLNADATCRVERRAYDAGRGAGQEGVGRWRRKRHARGGTDSRLGGQGTRGAHFEHGAHVRDAGRIEAQRLVERVRTLPSPRKEGACDVGRGVRAGRRKGRIWRWRRKRHARGEGPTQGLGVRARAERTWNMYFMFPTLDVSKLSGWLNACAPCAKSKGGRTMWGEVCGPGGGWRRGAVGQRKSGMHGEGPIQGLGARARAERTP